MWSSPASPGAPYLHGFGARYDLPIALSLYISAAAAVVVVSFLLVAVFAGGRLGEEAVRYPRRDLIRLRGRPAAGALAAAAGAFGVAFLLAIILTGWLGGSTAERNPAEYLLWIYFWAGLVMLSGLLGPLWDAVNPFVTLHRVLNLGRRQPDEAGKDRLASLGLWPAVVLYFGFACLELTSGYANRPWLVASLAAGYTVLTLLGMQVYGAWSWLRHFEFFTVLFSIVSRFAPIQVEEGRLYLRPPGAGLLDPWPSGWDRVTFLILMLSTLAFDGLLATPLWQGLVADLAPYWQPLGAFGTFAVRTFGLLDVTLLFLAIFVGCVRMVIFYGGVRVESVQTVTAFGLTLVPIALVYNAAHNYSYLIVQSQGLIPLLADPFARGWHLLPVQGVQPSFALAQASTVWYVQVVLIVLGHVVAVYLAHLRACERFRAARNVLLSQYPMLLLMVAYTTFSLWILAQPITD